MPLSAGLIANLYTRGLIFVAAIAITAVIG
jgi:hypothetical protein